MKCNSRTRNSRTTTAFVVSFVTICSLVSLPDPVFGQYFGRNKVQYETFDFKILNTPHFDIHFYPEAGEAVEDAARMGERWYERFARLFQHEFERPKPLILYADHPDFQQTNTLSGQLSEGTGGVTTERFPCLGVSDFGLSHSITTLITFVSI